MSGVNGESAPASAASPAGSSSGASISEAGIGAAPTSDNPAPPPISSPCAGGSVALAFSSAQSFSFL